MTHTRTARVVRWWRFAGLLAHLGVAAAMLGLLFPRASRKTRRRLHGWWSGRLLRILNITSQAKGALPLGDASMAMVVANHISWVDVFFVSSIRTTRFIAKSEVRDWPVVGWVTERAGTIFIRRARRRDTARINEEVHAALGEGDCVGLFPEGTTTEGDRLLKFHSSLFEPAVANGARVYPAAIRYQYPDGSPCRAMAYVGDLSFMQSLGLILRQRTVTAQIVFGEPIDAAGRTRRDIAQEAEARVASLLGLPPSDRAPRKPGDLQAAPP